MFGISKIKSNFVCIMLCIDSVNEAKIMEEYGNEVGLDGLEWPYIFDPSY